MGLLPKKTRSKILLILALTITYSVMILTLILYTDPEKKNVIEGFISQAKEAMNSLIPQLNSNYLTSFEDKEDKQKVEKDTHDVEHSSLSKRKENLPHYLIRATLDDQSYQINGEVELTMYNPGTKTLLFYAYPYDWMPMKINEVRMNDQQIDYEYDQKNLTFKNITEEEQIHISIQFETLVPRGGTRFGVKDNVWLMTTWYPILGVLNDQNQWIKRPDPIDMGDPFYFRFANYTVEWTSSSDIQWVSSGTLQYETVIDDLKQITWEVDQVRNFALVGSPDYTIETFTLNDKTTVSVALTTEDNMEKVLDIAQYTFSLFQSLYGELPYDDVAIAETSFGTNYALEYPNLAIFSKDMYAKNRIEHWIPHEIGHMWWYNAVGVDETVNGWLDEGLAEQGVALYLEHRYFKGEELRNRYREKNHALTHNYPNQTMNVGLYGFGSYQEFDSSWYARSADLFLTLREALGNRGYVTFLKTLYQNNIGKVITEESLNEALAEALGLETTFFRQWIHEPYFKTEWNVEFTNRNEHNDKN